jgi:hypothetical protein
MEVKDFALRSLDDAHAAMMQALDGLSDEEVLWQPQPGANHIAFILWHMFRIEDWFFQYMFQRVPQVWEAERWHQKLGLPDDARVTGWGYTADQVDSFPRVPLRDLLDYVKAVRGKTVDFIQTADAATFDREVTSRVLGEATVGLMIAHLVAEVCQHAGHICFLRGLIRGPNK